SISEGGDSVSLHEEPLISVLTPVFNGEDYLAECIESVLAQTYSKWEYIIVNNCSTDRTLEIALDYAKKDGRIRVHNNRELLGVPYVFGSPTSLLYRSDLIRESQAFYPHSNPHADTSACYQALEHSDFGFVHQVLAYARIHADSQTSKSLKVGTYNLALMGDL